MTDQEPTVRVTSEPEETEPAGIIFFDYDGVLHQGSSWRAVHHTLDTVDSADEHYELYMYDEISFAEWGHRDASLWEGATEAEFRGAIDRFEMVDRITETITALHNRGYIVGVVSGGIAQFIDATVGNNGFDFVIANEVHMEEGMVTGEVSMDVTTSSKPTHYRELADRYDIKLEHSITIGDSWDDFVPVEKGLNIAFNADDDQTRDAGDVIIESDDLHCILPAVDGWRAGLTDRMQTAGD